MPEPTAPRPPDEDVSFSSPLRLIAATALLVVLGLGILVGGFFLLERLRGGPPAEVAPHAVGG